jgi:hypothetical protein
MRRALVASWSSVEGGGPTVGDVLATRAALRVVEDCGFVGHVASCASANLHPVEVAWRSVDPAIYDVVLFVCGPVIGGSRPLRELLERFRLSRRIAVGVSILPRSSPDHWNPFDAVLARDGLAEAYGDLAPAWPAPSCARRAPLVGVVLRGRQREYGEGMSMHEEAAQLVSTITSTLDLPTLEIDTKVDRAGRDTDAIDRRFGRPSLVITTRLHGALLALRHGVPVLALDQIRGGAKVTEVLRRLGWPDTFAVELACPEELARRGRELLRGAGRKRIDDTRRRAIAEAHRTLHALRGLLNSC